MKDVNVVDILGKQLKLGSEEEFWFCDYLVKIIVQFDILLIQEVQDKTEKSLYSLLAAVNERPIEFKLIASPRLGRSDSKEQYAFFYRLTTDCIIIVIIVIIIHYLWI